jgi:hypothetical protein
MMVNSKGSRRSGDPRPLRGVSSPYSFGSATPVSTTLCAAIDFYGQAQVVHPIAKDSGTVVNISDVAWIARGGLPRVV